MPEPPPLHPELNLRYGQWIVIADQSHVGSLWYYRFPWPTIELIEQIVGAQQGWIMHRRVYEAGKPTMVFQRVLWLQTPAFQNWRQSRRR